MTAALPSPDALTSSKGPTMTDLIIVEAYKPKKPVSEMNEQEYAEHQGKVKAARAAGQKWNRQHPVRIKHVVDHWNQATPEEKESGMNWYADAHHVTRAVAHDTGHDMHTAAGMMSNYSPQTPWHTNMINAARVLRTRKPQGGKGEGIMATANQKHAAKRLLDGEHYDKVLSGPKTRAFAHLIEHGGNKDDNDPKVVIDRHALSVAAGARATDDAYGESRLGTKGRYAEVTNVYHKAAKQISKAEGRTVHPHQVQAATWLVRQRLNEEHDTDLVKKATDSSRSGKQAHAAMTEYNKYMGEHHPSAVGLEPGTGYSRQTRPEDLNHKEDMEAEGKPTTKIASRLVPSEGTSMVLSERDRQILTCVRRAEQRKLAYGEIKAPADVDTLQDETCPVCGESGLFSGGQCQVCEYIAPPKQFRDPDLTKARQMDLRKNVVDFQDQQDQQGLLDPTQLDSEGNPIPGTGADADGLVPGAQDPDDPTAQDPNAPLDPSQLDADGNPVPEQPQTDDQQMVQPSALTGDSGLLDPNALDADGQQPIPASNGAPGTPGDGVPDLLCPVCGFTTDASAPMSVDTQDKFAPPASDGTQAGDLCPNCGQGLLMSPNEQQQAQEQAAAPVPVQ